MTIFGNILKAAIEAVPGALGATFADWEGETVDGFSPTIGDTNLKLRGAHWGIIYHLARTAWQKADSGQIEELMLEFDNERAIIRRVTNEYYVVLLLARESNLVAARSALDMVEAQLREEM